jgi:hypothetical protein
MGHDAAAEFISYGFGAAGMVEVTMGQQKVFEFPVRTEAIDNVFPQSCMPLTASGIDQGSFISKANEIRGSIRRICQPAAAHLPEIIRDPLAHPSLLWSKSLPHGGKHAQGHILSVSCRLGPEKFHSRHTATMGMNSHCVGIIE